MVLWRTFENFNVSFRRGGTMKTLTCVFLLSSLCVLSWCEPSSRVSAPKVQVYSRNPGHHGVKNVLICHVNGFHPPEIVIELLEDGRQIPKSNQTDLAFEESWHYHLTRSAFFTPEAGKHFACRVTHNSKSNTYSWEADM